MSEPTVPSTVTTDLPADREIDATLGICDPPLLELMRWMRLLPVGSVLAVESSDPTDEENIPRWLRMVNYEFKGASPWHGHTRFVAHKTH